MRPNLEKGKRKREGEEGEGKRERGKGKKERERGKGEREGGEGRGRGKGEGERDTFALDSCTRHPWQSALHENPSLARALPPSLLCYPLSAGKHVPSKSLQ